MASPERIENFNAVLSTAMSGIRAVMDQAGLGEWQTFLLARDPAKADRFIVVSNPHDKSGFDAKLVALHQSEVRP